MKKWMTYLIVAIIIASVVGVSIAWNILSNDEEDVVLTVETGDSVTVHYTGWLRDDRIYDSRRIFDTSLEEIGDQTTLTFDDRQRGDPFKFTVGTGVIEGWSENVIGMTEGQTRTVDIPPEKAYDTRTEDLVFEVDRIEYLPVYETITLDKFTSEYGMFPQIGMMVEDAFWTWNKYVISYSMEHVELRHEPEVGEFYNAYLSEGPGWRSQVLSIDSTANQGDGEIVVEHHVNTKTLVLYDHLERHDTRFSDVGSIKRGQGQSPATRGIVVDVGADTITIDFNDEVAGRELTFRITVLEITKA